MSSARHPALFGIVAVVGLAALTAAAVPAPPQGTSTFAFVNTDAILRQTPGFTAAESTWTAEVAAMRAELEQRQQRLDSALAAFNQSSIGMSPTARQQKQAELQQLNTEYQQRLNDAQARSEQRQQELMEPLQVRVQAVIDGLRAERNLGIIFDVAAPGGGIVAGDPRLDLTSVVVTRLAAGG